jgi:hypothetical protein
MSENVGLIRVKQGDGTVEKMEKELRHLIDSKWQWEVKQVSDREFIAIFPNNQILETFSRSSGFELAFHKIVITVSPTDVNPASSSKLQEGWVLMSNIPDEARSVDAVTAIAELVGEVVVVDEVSLIKVGPVRAKIRARDIDNIRGFVEIFIEGEGFDIKFVPEATKKKIPKEATQVQEQKPDEGGYGGDDEDDLYDFDDDPTKKMQGSRGGESPKKQNEKTNERCDGRQRGRGEDMGDKKEGKDTQKGEGDTMLPLAVYDPIGRTFLELDTGNTDGVGTEEEVLTTQEDERTHALPKDVHDRSARTSLGIDDNNSDITEKEEEALNTREGGQYTRGQNHAMD